MNLFTKYLLSGFILLASVIGTSTAVLSIPDNSPVRHFLPHLDQAKNKLLADLGFSIIEDVEHLGLGARKVIADAKATVSQGNNVLIETVALLDQYVRNDYPTELVLAIIPHRNTVAQGNVANGEVFSTNSPEQTAMDTKNILKGYLSNPLVLGASEVSEDYLNKLILNNLEASIAAGWILPGMTQHGAAITIPTSRDNYHSSGHNSRGASIWTVGQLTSQTFTTGSANVTGDLTVDGIITGNISGTLDPGLTAGSILFQGTSGIEEDNSNFFWDDTNNGLGIGTTLPSAKVHVLGATEQLRLGYDTSNYWTSTVGSTGSLIMQGVGTGGL